MAHRRALEERPTTPLQLSDDEMSIYCAWPDRSTSVEGRNFCRRWWPPRSRAGEVGAGSFTIGRGGSRGDFLTRRRFRPNATAPAKAATPPEGLGGAKFQAGTYGRRRDYRSSSVLAFSHGPPLVTSQRKLDGRGRDELVLAVPATFVASVLKRSQPGRNPRSQTTKAGFSTPCPLAFSAWPRGTFELGATYRGMPWHNPPRFRRTPPAGSSSLVGRPSSPIRLPGRAGCMR